MVLLNKAFEKYINSYTSQKTRDRSNDSIVKELNITENEITAKVKGSKIYNVTIEYNKDKVKTSKCSCPFDMGPVCKHIVNVLINADSEFAEPLEVEDSEISTLKLEDTEEDNLYHPTDYIFENFSISDLTNTFILKNSLEFANDGKRGYFDLQVLSLKINQGTFKDSYSFYKTHPISIKFLNEKLIVSCECKTPKKKMCEHQVQLMYNIKDRKELRVFFDEVLRNEVLHSKALDYGLENEPILDAYFQLEYFGRELSIEVNLGSLVILETLELDSSAFSFLIAFALLIG